MVSIETQENISWVEHHSTGDLQVMDESDDHTNSLPMDFLYQNSDPEMCKTQTIYHRIPTSVQWWDRHSTAVIKQQEETGEVATTE